MGLNIFPNRQYTLTKAREDQTFGLSGLKPRLAVIVTSLLQELQELRGSASFLWHIRDSIELESDAFVLICVAGGMTKPWEKDIRF